jgi:hypothetical protein
VIAARGLVGAGKRGLRGQAILIFLRAGILVYPIGRITHYPRAQE